MLRALTSNLPEDVSDYIFYKLPVSSILSARAVCKSWKAKLDSSAFRKSYDLNCTTQNEWLVVSSVDNSISVHNTCLDRWFQIPCYERAQVCNPVCDGAGGLLLLSPYISDKVFVVGNPITHHWKQLPPLPLDGIVKCSKMVKGADATSYKVVVLVGDLNGTTPTVYDSELGFWCLKGRKDIQLPYISRPVICNGFIYAVSPSGDGVFKYNVEADELVGAGQLPDEGLGQRWLVAWKGNIYMFAGLIDEETPHRRQISLGAWVLRTDEWVLLSRSRRHLPLVTSYHSPKRVVWLDGDTVKHFVCGSSSVLTYNLAVAHSWSIIENGCTVPHFLGPSVCMPLGFTAAP